MKKIFVSANIDLMFFIYQGSEPISLKSYNIALIEWF